MTIVTDAQVQFVLADYAAVDTAGKLNVIGGSISFVGSGGPGQPTSPFTLAATVLVPAKYANQTYALSIDLYDVTTGNLVMILGEGGQVQALRAQQAVTVSPLQVPPGMAAPPDAMQGTTLVMQFLNGLPLTAGHSFEWRLQVDGSQRKAWWHRFHVLGPVVGPVFGGPAGSPTIPGVGSYTEGEPPEDPGAPEGN